MDFHSLCSLKHIKETNKKLYNQLLLLQPTHPLKTLKIKLPAKVSILFYIIYLVVLTFYSVFLLTSHLPLVGICFDKLR